MRFVSPLIWLFLIFPLLFRKQYNCESRLFLYLGLCKINIVIATVCDIVALKLFFMKSPSIMHSSSWEVTVLLISIVSSFMGVYGLRFGHVYFFYNPLKSFCLIKLFIFVYPMLHCLFLVRLTYDIRLSHLGNVL